MSKVGMAEGCRRVPRHDPAQYLGDNGNDELPFTEEPRDEELDALLAEYGFIEEGNKGWTDIEGWESAKSASPVRQIPAAGGI
jgi:hypothetical protein